MVIARLVLTFALPLNFYGRVRVVRSMYLPAALHGIDSSLLASDSLRRLRSAVRRVGSRRQPLAGVGAVLSLLDGPLGVTVLFVLSGFGFVCFVGILIFGLRKFVGSTVSLRWWLRVCPGHGPVHLLSASAAEIGFRWDPDALAWSRPGLPLLFGWPSSAFQGCYP